MQSIRGRQYPPTLLLWELGSVVQEAPWGHLGMPESGLTVPCLCPYVTCPWDKLGALCPGKSGKSPERGDLSIKGTSCPGNSGVALSCRCDPDT